jgi:hypothetical protein
MRRTLVFLSLLAACGELPDPQLVIEPRILAAQAWVVEPPPTIAGGIITQRAEAMPLETVRIDPLWIDPHGVVSNHRMDPIWIACELPAGAPPFTCISDRMPIAPGDLPACPVEDPATAIMRGPIDVPSPCLLARAPAPEYVVPLSNGMVGGSDIEITVVSGVADGSTTDECARQLLGGEWNTSDDCLFGVQVVPIGPKVLLLEKAAEAGLIELPPGLPPADDPDTHPHITSFRVVELGDDDQPIGESREVFRGEVVDVELGTRLRIDTTSPAGDLQTYTVPINDGAGVIERHETYAGTWYRTWGKQLATGSLEPESWNEWTLEPSDDDPDRPDDDLAHLFYVVRDGRHGVAWWWFAVRIAK